MADFSHSNKYFTLSAQQCLTLQFSHFVLSPFLVSLLMERVYTHQLKQRKIYYRYQNYLFFDIRKIDKRFVLSISILSLYYVHTATEIKR